MQEDLKELLKPPLLLVNFFQDFWMIFERWVILFPMLDLLEFLLILELEWEFELPEKFLDHIHIEKMLFFYQISQQVFQLDLHPKEILLRLSHFIILLRRFLSFLVFEFIQQERLFQSLY